MWGKVIWGGQNDPRLSPPANSVTIIEVTSLLDQLASAIYVETYASPMRHGRLTNINYTNVRSHKFLKVGDEAEKRDDSESHPHKLFFR